MNIALITVGYNLPGATQALVGSALQGLCGSRHQVTFILFSHTRDSVKVHELETLARRPDVIYLDYGFNRGLAKSWNEGILLAESQRHDAIIVANEDITFCDRDLDRLADASLQQRDKYIVSAMAFHQSTRTSEDSGYACFAINPIALQTIGSFDENFFPIYCEDNDYRHRAFLAGLKPGLCHSTHLQHIGSASLLDPDNARQNHVTYARNRAYYLRKWGGESGQEAFGHPFNDPRFSYYIDPRVRERPFLDFDRTDHGIVQF